MTRICAITTVRNDGFFLKKWVKYYGEALGLENIFIILDGHDQNPPENIGRANLLRLPHIPLPRAAAMRRRALVKSDFASGLFRYFDMVIATDVDEFVVVDPDVGMGLREYLTKSGVRSSVSALGLDVGQHLETEGPLDPSRRVLEQRAFAHVSARYTKPAVMGRPMVWGSGMHRIKGRNFRIDPNLYLFHIGMVDQGAASERGQDADRLATGWGKHLKRREALYSIISNSEPLEGDAYFPIARRRQTWLRPLYAWNKPGMISGNPVVRIPERFQSLL